MRHSKRFIGDIGSTTVPKDITRYARIGVIQSVDPQSGTCTLRWYDKPTHQTGVNITQSFSGGTTIPSKGDTVIAVFDQFSRAYIVGYINLGHEAQVKSLKTLPKVKESEKFFEAGGSYIYIKQNGTIIFSTLTGGIVEFSNITQTWKYEVVNWKLITEGGTSNFGLVKRMIPSSDGSSSVQSIQAPTGDFYTEYNITLYEYADGTIGINPSATPIATITLGTVIDSLGNVINKNDNVTVTPTKQLVAKLDFKSGLSISIDKEGIIDIRGGKLKINQPSVDITDMDRTITNDTNDVTKGTRGQHVAREHDTVTIPIGMSYNDGGSHKGLTSLGSTNINTIAELLITLLTGAITGALLNPVIVRTNALTVTSEKLEGEITNGADNFLVGNS